MSSKLRVFHIINSFTRHGAELIVSEMAKLIDKSAFDVTVCGIVTNPNPAAERMQHDLHVNGVNVVDLGKQAYMKDITTPFRLRALIREYKADIVHTHCPSPDIYGRIAGLMSGRRNIVSTLHNTRYSYVRLNSSLSKVTSMHIAVSEAVKEWALRELHLSARKIKVIYNGVDVKSMNSDSGAHAFLKEREGLKGGQPIITCVGRLHEQKNHDCLLRAAKSLLDRGVEAQYLLIGDGPLEDDLTALAKELGIEDRVHFMGLRDDVADLLVISDLFVLPSMWEGFGIAIIEAMAAGAPVVASDVDGIQEIVNHGETGLLASPKDPESFATAMEHLLDNADIARNMVEKARADVEARFSLEATARHHERLYRNLIEN